jgi:hypothetical protein
MKIERKIFLLFSYLFLTLNPLNSFSQCFGPIVNYFPSTIDGVSVSQTFTGDVQVVTTFTDCGVSSGATYLGGSVLSGSPFIQTLTFTNPINSVIYILNASDSTSSVCETFTFTVDSGVLSCSQDGSSCLYTQSGNIFSANSTPSYNGHSNAAYITLTSTVPYTKIYVSGTGGNNGSFMALCSNSANGIGNNNSNTYINVHPNPNNGNMFVNYNITTTAVMEIVDLNGNLVGTYNLSVTSTQIEMKNDKLQSGIYLYRIISNNTVVKFGKVVIMK